MSTQKASRPGRQGAKAYLVSSAVSQACALVRYTLLARLLGPEQLGLAAILILTAQFFDAISDSGSDRFLIQDSEGNEPEVQHLVQSVFVGRGLFTASALFIFAWPLSVLYKAPALAPGFMLLAAAPLIAGLLHLDLRRAQRTYDFRSESMGMVLSETVALGFMTAAALILRDFRAVPIGLIARSIVLVAVSHLRAERPYRLGFSREHAPRLAKFATPLMLNGLLLFFGGQGDRIVVGNQLGLAALGHYSAVLLLIFYPTASLMKYLGALHMPRIAKERDLALDPGREGDIFAGFSVLLAFAIMVGFAIVGPAATVVLFGHKFREPVAVVTAIGVLQTSRFIRVWTATVGLGLGRSGNLLITNMVRLVALPAGIAGILLTHGLQGLVGGFTLGEILALCVGVGMLNTSTGRSFWLNFDRIGIYVAGCLLLTVWSILPAHAPILEIAALAAASAALGAALVWREKLTIRKILHAAQRAMPFRRLSVV